MCARSRNCVFQDDKKVYCYKHRDLISGKVKSWDYSVVRQFFKMSFLTHVYIVLVRLQIITGQGFEVNRRMYVDFDGISLRRKFLTGLEPENINLMIGIFVAHLSISITGMVMGFAHLIIVIF
jgi:hypothetical protein